MIKMSDKKILSFSELVERKRNQIKKEKELTNIVNGVDEDGFKPREITRKPIECLRIESYAGDWRNSNYATKEHVDELLHNQIEIDRDNQILFWNHIHLRKQYLLLLNEFELMKKVVKKYLDKKDQ